MRKSIFIAIAVVLMIAIVAFGQGSAKAMMPFERAMQECDSGDLILFVYGGMSLTRLSRTSRFTHAGIVYVGNDGTKYIVEAHADGDVKDRGGGVHVYELEKRVREYKGTASLAKLKVPLDSYQRARFSRDTFSEYQNIPFFDEYATHYVTNCLLSLGVERKAPGMFCSEFISHVQKRLGIGNARERDECMTPDNLVNPNFYDDAVCFHA